MIKCEPSAPSVDALVVQARKDYRKVLAQYGLLTFTSKEVAQARAVMQSQGRSRINQDDIRFQASITRLRSQNLTLEAINDAIRELIRAECECDQAKWERDCHQAVLMEHMHYRLPNRSYEISSAI